MIQEIHLWVLLHWNYFCMQTMALCSGADALHLVAVGVHGIQELDLTGVISLIQLFTLEHLGAQDMIISFMEHNQDLLTVMLFKRMVNYS